MGYLQQVSLGEERIVTICIPECGSGHFLVGFPCLDDCVRLYTTQNRCATRVREIFNRLAFTGPNTEALNSCPGLSHYLGNKINISEPVAKGEYDPLLDIAHFSPDGFRWGSLFCLILEFSRSVNYW